MDTDDVVKTTIAQLYDRVARGYGRVGPDPFGYAGASLVERLGAIAGARVLDVGVGRGANLFPAAIAVGARGQVIGVDLAERMLLETAEEIRQRNLRQAQVLRMDAEQLQFPPTSFDVVLCGFALFLFPHLDQALSEFLRVLRVGGRLGITLASHPDALSRWYGEHLTSYAERYHFPLSAAGHTVDLSDLPARLARIGFAHVQEQRERTEFVYADAQEWWDAKWTHGTRYSLEHMPPHALAQFQQDVFARLQEARQPDGIHEEWAFRYILADRGGSASASPTEPL